MTVIDHSAWQRLLDRYVSPSADGVNRFAYSKVSATDRSALKSYVEGLDIEHGILRKTWRDPRVHYAINCASTSCPNLPAEAFTGEKLEGMLAQGARDYINHPRAVRVEDGRIVLSQIYSWYRRDFGASDADVLGHIVSSAAPALKAKLANIDTIAGYDYDWSLNEAK